MTSQITIPSEMIQKAYKNESRSFCPKCEFLKSRCLCETIREIDNKINIIILQHKSETKHALNTARILVKSLKNILLLTGEDFTNNEELNAIIESGDNKCALIFPADQAEILSTENKASWSHITHLILIDGTWRKAKKVFYLSRNLHTLPAFRLVPKTQSQYKIRKSPSINGLSTLEATVESLKILEPELDTQSLNLSFKKMIDWQIKSMGEDVYKKNYTDKRLEQH